MISPVPGVGEIELEVLSISPRVYRVNNFVSDAEIAVLKQWAVDKRNPHSMRPSTVGAQSWSQKVCIFLSVCLLRSRALPFAFCAERV